jgi:Flp pilus assembly protein TadB
MPDNDDDNLVHFRPRTKSENNGRKRQEGLRVDPLDVIASGAVIAALLCLVAMVSQSLPISAYTVGIVACSSAAFVVAKLIRARRPKASGIRFPRNGK